MKKTYSILLLLLSLAVKGQEQNLFENSYQLINKMLQKESSYSFKNAVFSSENAYLDNSIDTTIVNTQIRRLTMLCKSLISERTLIYNEKDKDKIAKFASAFAVMCDTIPIQFENKIYHYEPFAYDFNDVFGHSKRESLFVTKLLATGKGNCRSLPYLYKILCEQLGVEANLALAPNHIYIKHKNIRDGWYNTELTSGIFPIDSWIMASGYVHIDAIKNGVYMKALNSDESLALILVDLAENYNVKFPNNDGTFILKCCETALKYYPNFATGLILKAETHKKQIDKISDKTKHEALYKELAKEYSNIHELGYRNMPESMYLNWLVLLKKERSKYESKKMNTFNKK